MNYLPARSGFTLIELLVVIAVLGFVMAVMFPNFMGARQRARDTQRKSDVAQIQKALELYRMDQNPPAYPTGPFLSSLCNECWSGDGACVGSIYMRKLPCDPGSLNPTPYLFEADDTTYSLTACLENGGDPDQDPSPNAACASGYSYTVQEP